MPRWRRLFAGFALACTLGVASSTSLAHDDSEWEQDREAPYPGTGWTASQGGNPAVSFASQGVVLQSWLTVADLDTQATAANDIWGYVSPSGREYALVGISNGTAIVEVTNPASAQLIATIGGPSTSWRDIKTYQHYAYVVSEAGPGIQVLDLSQVDGGIVTLSATITTGGRAATHDVAIDTESGMLFRAGGGGNFPPLGIRIYDLKTPSTPAWAGEWHGRYCHDVQAVTWQQSPFAGVEVAFCYANDTTTAGNPGIEILDVSDPQNISVIGSINLSLPPIFSHAALYSHQGWLSTDRRYVYMNDEVDEGTLGNTTLTRVIDVQDLTNPIQVATFTNGNTARDHNLFTDGILIYQANYRSGLRIFSALNQLAPVEFAWFDTHPADDDAHYNGLWGVYPYFPSGVIVGSDIESGLFVWTLGPNVPALPGPMACLGAAAVGLAGLVAARRRAGRAC